MAMGAGQELEAIGVGWCSVWLDPGFTGAIQDLGANELPQPREASGTTELFLTT